MYNSTQIKMFINNVNKEAEEAAQAVYDKYQSEFISRVEAQLRAGDTLFVGNGTAVIENKKGRDVGESFCEVISNHVHYSNIHASFSIDYKTKK